MKCLTENVRNIFDQNIRLLGDIDKAIYYFREQQYDTALGLVAHAVDLIKYVIEAIITDIEYFKRVDTESMLVMLTGILDAKKNKDLILLADLLELQLVNFLIGIQELIMSKEEILFNEDSYKDNIKTLLEHSDGITEQLMDPINTTHLLESGYSIEFTSCGQMTLATECNNSKFYFHTNNKIQTEAFLLARQWYQKEKRRYLVYGFGLGYHLKELQYLAPEATIEVYEADHNVLQLACAFTDIKELFVNKKLRLFHDPKLEILKERLQSITDEEKVLIHYPSIRNLKVDDHIAMLKELLPWAKVIDEL